MDPRLLPAGPLELCAELVVPAKLLAAIRNIHGHADVAVPPAFADFHHTHGGPRRTLRGGAPDPYGWQVYAWGDVVRTSLARYTRWIAQRFDADVPTLEYSETIGTLRESGVWLPVGCAGDRHEHFLCCDLRRREFGQVFDLNDGDPSTGLVPDATYADFTVYLR